MAGGFRDLLRKSLGWLDKPVTLLEEQKTLGGIPTFSLTIGAHDLSAFVIAYIYEEVADRAGGLSIWLDNRDARFDDLSTDYPDIVRGVAIDFERGLVVRGSPKTEKLPQTWIDGLQYTPAGQLILSCIDWRGKLEKFHYASDQTFSGQTHYAIASSILSQVSLTLAAGSFGFTTDIEAAHWTAAHILLRNVMSQAHEILYSGYDGEILFRQIDPGDAADYSYDWSNGGGSDHPLLPGTEITEQSAAYNTITVTGGSAEEYSATATSASEVALVGTRRLPIRALDLGSNAECLEAAEGYLNAYLAVVGAGVIVARPHFSLRLYDMLLVAAPPWGGPASTGRALRIFERYNSFTRRWGQEITVGAFPILSLGQRARIGELRGRRRK